MQVDHLEFIVISWIISLVFAVEFPSISQFKVASVLAVVGFSKVGDISIGTSGVYL